MLELRGHTGTIHALAFASDGRTLFTAGKDQTIRVWNVAEESEVSRLEGHAGSVLSLAVHRNGKVLASGGSDRSLKIWRLPDGRLIDAFPKQMAAVTGVGWLPDRPGSLVMLCGERLQPERGGELRLWDLAEGSKPKNLRLDSNGFWSLAVAAHAPCIAFGGGARNVAAWNLTQQEPATFRIPSPSLAVAISPDGNLLACTVDRTVKLMDIARRREITTIEGHKGLVRALAFSPTGRILATGSQDQTVKFWSIENGMVQASPVYQWPIGGVHALAFSPDGMLAAAAGESGAAWIWDLDL